MTKNAKFKSNPTVLAQYRNVKLQLPVDISHTVSTKNLNSCLGLLVLLPQLGLVDGEGLLLVTQCRSEYGKC